MTRCLFLLRHQMLEARENEALDMVEQVADELVTVSSRPMAETYGGDVDAITWVMQEMVNDVDVKVHDISNQTKRRDVVKKVNQVCA